MIRYIAITAITQWNPILLKKIRIKIKGNRKEKFSIYNKSFSILLEFVPNIEKLFV